MIALNDLNKIRNLLAEAKVIAIVGLSPKEERPSNMVARYLIDAGYTILPVNPGHDRILGLPCFPSLLSIEDNVDIVDIFRKSEDVGPIVQQAIQIDCKVIWMQLGISNHAAAEIAWQHGKEVVMDRCIKVDHANLLAPKH
ncbi:CoA-binding protein [Desulfopila inferna]|uniref:CoA-binding protein n=1 Tax=Desulfopila inferna TaxID=468528 RepID=UPI00196453BD|nr:CoA-binding protein [Desulfopila inferna]MBM9606213.1 CoA-binding protein [Desulfopila inferna]